MYVYMTVWWRGLVREFECLGRCKMDKIRKHYLSPLHTKVQYTLRTAKGYSEEAGQLNHVDMLEETSIEGMKHRRPEKGEELRGGVISQKNTL